MDNSRYKKMLFAILIVMALVFGTKPGILQVHDESRQARNQQQFAVFSLTIYHNSLPR